MTFTAIVRGTLCPLTDPLEDIQEKKDIFQRAPLACHTRGIDHPLL